jgi:hypothetical protein
MALEINTWADGLACSIALWLLSWYVMVRMVWADAVSDI